MIDYNSLVKQSVSEGNFEALSILTSRMELFDKEFPSIASKIIEGCKINKESKILYLLFLELSSVINKELESYNVNELKDIRSKLVREDELAPSDLYYRDEIFFRNWFKKNILEEYIKLLQKLFDCAYSINLENNDPYASEIVTAICQSSNIDLRVYALLHMEDVDCFLDDEDDDVVRVADEIINLKNTINDLPLDAKLLIDLLESGIANSFIKIDKNNNPNKKHIISSSLFKESYVVTLPNYYFHMSDYKMIAYKIYEAIINKELEFNEGKEPSFYVSLCSNNPRRI